MFTNKMQGIYLQRIPIFLLPLLTACASTAITNTPVAAKLNAAISTPTDDPNATPTSIWFALQERTPYPYLTPLPPPNPSVIDGTYVKSEESLYAPVHCRRCPDYASDGGIWILRFDKGIYRIHSRLTGWRSVGSYSLTEDRLTLFNDVYCGNEIGTYAWSVEQRKLVLEEIKDDCSFRLRAKNLTLLPWASCQPPNIEAAISDHWQIPAGCRE